MCVCPLGWAAKKNCQKYNFKNIHRELSPLFYPVYPKVGKQANQSPKPFCLPCSVVRFFIPTFELSLEVLFHLCSLFSKVCRGGLILRLLLLPNRWSTGVDYHVGRQTVIGRSGSDCKGSLKCLEVRFIFSPYYLAKKVGSTSSTFNEQWGALRRRIHIPGVRSSLG